MDYEKVDLTLYNYLMDLRKWFNQDYIKLCPGQTTIDVLSSDLRCSFLLDYDFKGKFEPKFKTQLRYQLNNSPLIRIDLNAIPHDNFIDGTRTGRNHIHIWRMIGNQFVFYGYDLDDFEKIINDDSSFYDIFCDFCSYCNIDHLCSNIQAVV